MRVMLVTQLFTPTITPGTMRWDWLSSLLAERGVDITVVGAQPRPFSATQPASERPTPGHGPRVGLARRALREGGRAVKVIPNAFRVPRPDAVAVTVPPVADLPAAWLVSKLRRAPLVLDLRDAWPELFDTWSEWGDGRRPSRRWLTPVLGMTMRLISLVVARLERSAVLTLTTSAAHSDALRERGFSPVITVPNAAGQHWRVPPVDLDRTELRVLYMGNVGRAQHLDTAIEALALLGDDVRVSLRIVGAGVHVEHLRVLARERGVDVEFMPRVSRVDIREQYLWSDTCLVMLRPWPQLEMSVPSKLHEIMAFGRHVSASLNGEPADIVREAHAGDVVPAGDAGALAELWRQLAADRSRLLMGDEPQRWLAAHDDREALADEVAAALAEVTHGR